MSDQSHVRHHEDGGVLRSACPPGPLRLGRVGPHRRSRCGGGGCAPSREWIRFCPRGVHERPTHVPPGFAVIASWVHPEPEIVLVHEGIGIRGIALSPNGKLDSVDDLPPYLDAALSEALTQFQDEVVTELGRAWPELPDTGSLA